MGHTFKLLFFVSGCLVAVFGYPSGKISASCDTMLPVHGSNSPQSSAAPYAITISNTTFIPGDNITVSLTSNATSSGFKGFLLEARLVGGNGLTGTFSTTDPNAQILTCRANTAVSHNSNSLKSTVTAVWTAPQDAGYIRFTATILGDYSTFWTGVKSDIISTSQISNVTCGTQKFCLSDPVNCSLNDKGCFFMSASPCDGIGYVFEMSSLTSGYVAIGFSDDTKMGNDDVYICTQNSSGQILVQHGYNTGTVAPQISNTTTAGSIVASYVNGTLKCSFITQSAISTQQRSSANTSYYVFLVKGASGADGQIQQHTKTLISNTTVDLSSFSSFGVSGALSGTSSLILGHGALMLIAWMTTGSIGMIMARYMKSAAGKPFLGKAIWFQTHFFLMILTVVLTIIAFIMIFAEVAGWSADAGAHPVLGCIVMILSFFQPIGAMFRPDPKNERRFIFNWVHRLNALVIKVLAVATIFLGLKLIDLSSTQWLAKVMGGFFAWEILFYIILETIVLLKTKNIYETTDDQVQSETVAVVVFICGNLAFLIALLVGIGQS